jgi:hypothetical protein
MGWEDMALKMSEVLAEPIALVGLVLAIIGLRVTALSAQEAKKDLQRATEELRQEARQVNRNLLRMSDFQGGPELHEGHRALIVPVKPGKLGIIIADFKDKGDGAFIGDLPLEMAYDEFH